MAGSPASEVESSPASEVESSPASGEPASAVGPVNPTRRKLRHVLILLFLTVQFALPLRYYLGDDRYDERFAWRMFSPIRMVKCQVAFVGQTSATSPREQVPMGRVVPQPWLHWMQRGHAHVTRAIGAHWCDEHRASGARPSLSVTMQCRLPGGEIDRPIPAEEDLCSN